MSAESLTTAEEPNSPKRPPSLLKAAGLIAGVTLISKVLGAGRDWIVMWAYGASLASDAYFAAVQIPWFGIILLGGLGGPFHTATVAVFSKLLAGKDRADEKARLLASTFLTLTGVVFLLLSIAVFVWAEPIMRVMLSDASPELVKQAAQHLRIMAPTFWLGGTIGILYGLANVFHHFFWPSISPAAMNIVMIGALLIFPHDPTGNILAWSTLVGALAQVLLQLPDILKDGFKLKPAWRIKMPELKDLSGLLFPAMLGTTIGQLTIYVDIFFTSTLALGSWTAIVMANRLIQLPIGVLQTALLVPVFPRLATQVAEQDWDGLRDLFRRGVVSLWFVSIPMLIILLLQGESWVRLVFEHGQFDSDDTHLVSQALVYLAFSMLPYFARDTLTRVFYAFGDAKTPLMVGAIAIGSKAVLDALLVGPFGVGGITLATTAITLINMILLSFFLRRKHMSHMGYSRMVVPFLKLISAGALMAAALWGLTQWSQVWLTDVVPPSANQIIKLLVSVGQLLIPAMISMLLYGLFVIWLKIEGVDDTIQRLLSRFLPGLFPTKPVNSP